MSHPYRTGARQVFRCGRGHNHVGASSPVGTFCLQGKCQQGEGVYHGEEGERRGFRVYFDGPDLPAATSTKD